MAATAADLPITIPAVLHTIFPDAPQSFTAYKNNVSYHNNTLLGITTQHLANNVGFTTLKTPRAIYETTAAKRQCTTAIGITKDQAYGRPCSVCLLPMLPRHGFTPECDHILPIAQAVQLTHLEQSKRVSKAKIIMPSTIDPSLVYQWLHILCNRIKLDWVFIMIRKDIYVPDTTKLRKYLYNLWNNRYTTTQYEYFYRKNDRILTNGQTEFTYALWTHYKEEYNTIYGVYGTFKEVCDYFVETRCDAMIHDVYQPLCDHLNETGNPYTNVLTGAIAASHGPRHMTVATPDSRKKKRKGASSLLSPRTNNTLRRLFGRSPSTNSNYNGGTRRKRNHKKN
jgi:hypothetical protein